MRWTLFIAAKDSSPPKNPAMPDESRLNLFFARGELRIGNRNGRGREGVAVGKGYDYEGPM